MTMTTDHRKQWHLAPFVSYFCWAVKQDHALAQFRTDTGNTYAPPKSGLDRMIDKATGADRAFILAFVQWCASQYGTEYLPDDYLDQIMQPAAGHRND